MSGLLGPFLVLTFSLSQAFRDVYFGRLFQGVDFFAIILLAFVLSTAVFAPLAFFRARADFAILRASWRTVLAMNVTTAIAWICYFFGLSHLEPSIVNTIHSGMAPLTAAVMSACGIALAKPQRMALMVLPLYAQQQGVARTAPLTAQIVRALGPVFVFALEQIDSRLHYAPAVLLCILAYSIFVVAGNIAHGWRPEARAGQREQRS